MDGARGQGPGRSVRAMSEDFEPVRPFLICEPCTYIMGRMTMLYEWEDLIAHMRDYHWIQSGVAGNGQPIYQCSGCESTFQLSFEPVVDFAGNLFCGSWCVKDSYLKRLTTHDTIAMLAQERADEEYALKSLKGEL